MRVRAEVVRQIPLDVRQLPIERDEQLDQPRRSVEPAISYMAAGLSRTFHEKIDRPHPRDRSKRELEHARPVDADERRVGVEPAGKLGEAAVTISRIAGQPVRTT